MTPQYIEIDKDNNKSYYKDKEMNTLHREDGPALEYADISKSWFPNGKAWYLNGVYLTEQNFLLKTAKEIVLTMDEIAAKFGIEVSKLKIAK
jgi:hypothetical protein